MIHECEDNITWCTNFSERHRAIEEVVDLCYDLLPALASGLNKIHKINYSQRYWHIILGAWLYEFSSVVYDRKKLLDGYSQTNETIQSIIRERIIPRTTYESLKLAEVEEFNTQIFNDILSERIEKGSKKSHDYDSKFGFNTDVTFSTNNNIKITLFNLFMSKIINKNNIVVSLTAIPLKYQWSLFLKWTGIRPIKPVKELLSDFSFDTNYDQRGEIASVISNISTQNDALKSIIKLLPFYIPKCFLESYQKLEVLTDRYKGVPKAIIITTECYGRVDAFLNWVATCSEKGTKICIMQHGGNYGFEYRTEYNFVEIGPVDIFYTWGWLWPKYRIEQHQLRKMPSFFLLGQPIMRQRQAINKILFCSTSIEKTVRSFVPSSGSTYYKNEYIKKQLQLYRALSEDVKKIFHIRAYKDDLTGANEIWSKEFPNAIFEDLKNDYLSSLSGTSLYVSDHMSTTWLEALVNNVPIIVYFPLNIHDMAPEMREILDMLNKVSVVHYDTKSAADTINTVYVNVDAWWNEKNRAKTILNVRNTLILSSSKLIKDWAAELKIL